MFVEVTGTDGRFGGFCEALVGTQDLERFATQLLAYPLGAPVTFEAGRSAADREARDIRPATSLGFQRSSLAHCGRVVAGLTCDGNAFDRPPNNSLERTNGLRPFAAQLMIR